MPAEVVAGRRKRRTPSPLDRLFTPLSRRVLRKRIPPVETMFGAIFVVALAAATAWILAQRDAYDPADRDVSIEVLEKDSVEDTLYRLPTRLWVEPGTIAAAGAAGPDLGVFPPSLLDGGWSLDGRIEVYDKDNLYEKINGQAEQYLAYGFRALHSASLSNGGDSLAIELYDQDRFPNVLGLFSAQRSADRVVEQTGPIAWYATPAGVAGAVGRWYFKVAGSSDGEPVRKKARQLVDAFADLPVAAASVPRPYRILTNRLGLPFDRIAYHPNDAFQFSFASDFWFATAGRGEARWFLHEAADEPTAVRLFDQLVGEQKNEYVVVDESPNATTLRHEFLSTIFLIRREGALVFGVDGSDELETARELAGQIARAATEEAG